MAILWVLIVGALAGWLAGLVMKGRGFGVVGNIVLGIVGAFAGNFIFSALGVSLGGGLVGSLLTAMIGAIVILAIVGLIKRA